MIPDNPRADPLEKKLLDHLITAVLLFDGDLYLTYINPAGEILLGASAHHVLGQSIGMLMPWPECSMEQRLRDALSTRQPVTEREVTIPLSGDCTVRVNCTVLPLQHLDAASEVLVELCQVDRHLRIVHEEHLISQHQAAQALIRGLAHEIKNPLGGLRGAAQLLEQELPGESFREHTRVIIGEVDRLRKLIDEMLGPNLIPKRQSINIYQVLEHVCGLLSAEYPAGPVIIRDYDPSIPNFSADPDRLIQAVLNLARNAIAASGPDGRVELRTRVLRRFTIGTGYHRLVMQIEVIDDGEGIAPDLLDRIFLPMVSGRPDGTGLGLPIAQELINQHGGLIECESRPGKTRFFIYLPLESSHD